ncbi:MAG TPA: alpha/beta hydrolase [Xanthobacteraceae bacterium]|nr:alpha/beta hydrolase [Xanthobacteraceae bacterium]
MAAVLIIPGLGGSPEQHWQTHLERARPGATRVEQEDWDNPRLSAWLERVAAAVARNPGAILVAHSLGCALVAHLAQREPRLPIGAALLVAPADVDSARHTPDCLRGFAPVPTARLPFRSVLVGSRNDPYMTFARARALSFVWGASFVDAGAAGHINIDSGFGPWPEGNRLLAQLAAEDGARRPAPWREGFPLPAAGRAEVPHHGGANFERSIHSNVRGAT